MMFSSDEQFLFTAGEDGSVFVYTVYDAEGLQIKQKDADATFADEILIFKSDLQAKVKSCCRPCDIHLWFVFNLNRWVSAGGKHVQRVKCCKALYPPPRNIHCRLYAVLTGICTISSPWIRTIMHIVHVQVCHNMPYYSSSYISSGCTFTWAQATLSVPEELSLFHLNVHKEGKLPYQYTLWFFQNEEIARLRSEIHHLQSDNSFQLKMRESTYEGKVRELTQKCTQEMQMLRARNKVRLLREAVIWLWIHWL